MDKERSYADKVEAELKTRERQLRKIQDKIDEEDKRYTDVQAKIEIVAQEKQDALAERREIQLNNDLLVDEIEQLKR